MNIMKTIYTHANVLKKAWHDEFLLKTRGCYNRIKS